MLHYENRPAGLSWSMRFNQSIAQPPVYIAAEDFRLVGLAEIVEQNDGGVKRSPDGAIA
jgi:hypothetical protein